MTLGNFPVLQIEWCYRVQRVHTARSQSEGFIVLLGRREFPMANCVKYIYIQHTHNKSRKNKTKNICRTVQWDLMALYIWISIVSPILLAGCRACSVCCSCCHPHHDRISLATTVIDWLRKCRTYSGAIAEECSARTTTTFDPVSSKWVFAENRQCRQGHVLFVHCNAKIRKTTMAYVQRTPTNACTGRWRCNR